MKIHLSGASDLAFSTSVGPSMCLQPVMASSLARPRAKTGPLQKKHLITILIVNSNKKRKRDIKKIHCIWKFSKSCTVLKQPTFKYHDQAAVLFLILELQPWNQHFILPNCTTGIIFNNKYIKHSWLLFTWNFFFLVAKKKIFAGRFGNVDLAKL